jgi:S1-C subfamily serine protease
MHGGIGLKAQDINQELADHFHLENDSGALVSDVQNNSPAGRAGLQREDVLPPVSLLTIKK